MSQTIRRAAVLAILALVLSACAGSGAFTYSARDNDPADLARAFALESSPAAGTPRNSLGRPLAFLVTAGPVDGRKLLAWDLDAKQLLWKVSAKVTSRVVVGSKIVAAREGANTIVARSVTDGRALWSHQLPENSTFLGAAADGEQVFYVRRLDGARRSWSLVALGPGGSVNWTADAPGTLGTPAARGGLVYMPFLTQWLAILDAKTGKQIARLLQKDEALNFVRTTSDGVFYGSKGIFLLDEHSFHGTRGDATYGGAVLPDELRAVYHSDSFSEVQAGYSAFDRNRVLWRAFGDKDGLRFQDDLAVLLTYRFFFAFDATSGALRWVHNHARHDVVSAEHVGSVIAYVSLEGEIGALDVKTGALAFQQKVGERLIGATFDADGFGAVAKTPPPTATEGLASIVWDRDARFGAVKLYAITALGRLGGAGVTEALLRVILDETTAQPVSQKAAEVLIARKDAEALPLLLAALAPRYDFLEGTKPRAVDVVARALGAIGRTEAVPALLAHLANPETSLGVAKEILSALGDIGAGGGENALPALRTFLLVYRTDPALDSNTSALTAAIDALLRLGGGAGRETVAFVAGDAGTQPRVAEAARRALAKTNAPATAAPTAPTVPTAPTAPTAPTPTPAE